MPYRNDRIGPHPVLDLDLTNPSWPTEWSGNFDTDDAPNNGSPVMHFRSATVREDHDQVTWIKNQTINLSSAQAIGFGCALEGASPGDSDLGMLWGGHASLLVEADADEVSLGVLCGRLASSTVDVTRTAANNTITNPHFLRWNSGNNGVWQSVNWSGSFVSADFDDDGFGTNPMAFGVLINNHGSTAATIGSMILSVSFQRYNSDLRIFEPSR